VSHKLSFTVKVLRDVGNIIYTYIAIVFHDRIPEYPRLSRPVHPRPPQVSRKGIMSYDGKTQKEASHRRC
jgi:hypothetical protein